VSKRYPIEGERVSFREKGKLYRGTFSHVAKFPSGEAFGFVDVTDCDRQLIPKKRMSKEIIQINVL